VKGKPLTGKQRSFMGAVASGYAKLGSFGSSRRKKKAY
jgi:hypothetical protein